MLVRIMACDAGGRIVWSTFGFRFEVDSPMTEGNRLYNASAEAEFNVKSMHWKQSGQSPQRRVALIAFFASPLSCWASPFASWPAQICVADHLEFFSGQHATGSQVQPAGFGAAGPAAITEAPAGKRDLEPGGGALLRALQRGRHYSRRQRAHILGLTYDRHDSGGVAV